MPDLVHRITVDVSELHRIAREVVATTPAPMLAEALVTRLRELNGEGGIPEIAKPRPEVRDAVRSRLRRLGA